MSSLGSDSELRPSVFYRRYGVERPRMTRIPCERREGRRQRLYVELIELVVDLGLEREASEPVERAMLLSKGYDGSINVTAFLARLCRSDDARL